MIDNENEADGNVHLSLWSRIRLFRALRLYERGEYERAEALLIALVNADPELQGEVAVFRFFCNNVARVTPSTEDTLYERGRAVRKAAGLLWLPVIYLAVLAIRGSELAWLPAALTVAVIYALHKIFRGSRTDEHRVRCKHCGHFTGYIAPNEGMGWLGTNNCHECGRSYPMPSTQWDTEWGLQYISERGSAPEKEFSEERQAIAKWLRPDESKAGV